jgi:UDP-N-acetylglucosamine 2-epimerase (non-hydrolysing)
VDDKWVLGSLLIALNNLAQSVWKKLFFPIHPRTKGAITRFWLDHLLQDFIVTEPLPYSESLCLYSNAHVIATDSWGIQEEANILNVPTLILRENTERPEVLEGGGAAIAWNHEDTIIRAYSILMNTKIVWNNIFGDGTAGEQIIKILTNACTNKS